MKTTNRTTKLTAMKPARKTETRAARPPAKKRSGKPAGTPAGKPSGKPAAKASSAFEEVYKVVRRIPHGRVATYGQVARLLPKRWSPALVGWALHALPQGSEVPWHRVVDASGALGTRRLPGDSCRVQEDLLEHEGVELDVEGRCDLARHQWEAGMVNAAAPRALNPTRRRATR